MSTPHLSDVCSAGQLDPDDWCDALIAMVSNSNASNQDLLRATYCARQGLSDDLRQTWMDNLLEFSLWETGSNPERLALCDYMVREGLACVHNAKRWRNFGGLLHVACEAASFEGIRWALEREPHAARRVGERHGLSVFHALCSREDDDDSCDVADMLAQHGAFANARTVDGRNALFRCSCPALARKLIELGADPWPYDSQGYGPMGRWLELGLWECASPALAAKREAIDEFHPWGSLAMRDGRPPMFDRPLFIVASSRSLKGAAGSLLRSRALHALADLGANPLLPDRQGLTLYQRGQCQESLSMMEQWDMSLSHDPTSARTVEGKERRRL
jgi:hypothetical protein